MKKQTIKQSLLGALLCVLSSQASADTVKAEYEVTIKNLTSRQVMTTPVLKTVTTDLFTGDSFNFTRPLFTMGNKSTQAMREMAEDGVTEGFNQSFFSGIFIEPGGIKPGQSKVYLLKSEKGFLGLKLYMASMLATTNDAFVGLEGIELSTYSGLGGVKHNLEVNETVEVFAPVFDAGTEENTESCADVPGPPCDSHFVGKPEEGVITAHKGLSLNGDIPEEYSFDPKAAAKVSIKRIK